MRMMPRCEDERQEQRKAARLALDTSAHASLEYQKILQQCSSPVGSPPELHIHKENWNDLSLMYLCPRLEGQQHPKCVSGMCHAYD